MLRDVSENHGLVRLKRVRPADHVPLRNRPRGLGYFGDRQPELYSVS
ncbi:hypothetical protein SAMN05444166_0755 [Singulisphaera sp. GP187]|nr:hypothetical protein SAMN05444166_0755 [Singulisphaera sp. GP187]